MSPREIEVPPALASVGDIILPFPGKDKNVSKHTSTSIRIILRQLRSVDSIQAFRGISKERPC